MPRLSCSVLCLDDWSALTEPGNVEGSVEGPIVARSIRKNHILSSPGQEHAGLHYGMTSSSPAATFVSWTCPSLDASTVHEDIIWPCLNIFDFSDFSLSFQHAIVFHYISRSLDGHWCSWSRCESGSHLRSVRSVRNNQILMATNGHHAAEGFHGYSNGLPWHHWGPGRFDKSDQNSAFLPSVSLRWWPGAHRFICLGVRKHCCSLMSQDKHTMHVHSCTLIR